MLSQCTLARHSSREMMVQTNAYLILRLLPNGQYPITQRGRDSVLREMPLDSIRRNEVER